MPRATTSSINSVRCGVLSDNYISLTDDNYISPSHERAGAGVARERRVWRHRVLEAGERRAGEEADGGNEQARQGRDGRDEGGHGRQDRAQVRGGGEAAVGDAGAARLENAPRSVRRALAGGRSCAEGGVGARGQNDLRA